MLKNYTAYDALGLAERVRAGKTTPDELLDSALEAAAQVEARIHALCNTHEAAARAAIKAGLPAGSFTGVPFLLKDLSAVARNFPMSSGSRFFEGTEGSHDTELVTRLRKSGLVIFGRTATPEMGISISTEAEVYGHPTANPWNTGYSAGGSSGGSGAAVAAGIVPMAHGSDGAGSIRIPASCCGILGLKPSRARLPSGPILGEGWGGLLTEGVLCRSVRDCAAFLDATHGPDTGAPYYALPFDASYGEAIGKKPRPLKIAYLKTTFDQRPIHPDVARTVEQTAELCRGLGHTVTEDSPADFDFTGMLASFMKVVACGVAMAIEARIRQLGREPGPDELEPSTRGAWVYSKDLRGPDYLQAVTELHRISRGVARFFESYDILLLPVLAEPPAILGRFRMNNPDFLDYRMGEKGIASYSAFTPLANMTGQPAISVPLFRSSDNLPIGSQFIGRAGEEHTLLQLAAQLEKAHPWFNERPPVHAKS
ncbi:MAG: amidase [Candidatus Accumulibacter sp.]|jgi:amidase/6-aminohexanoate-cyclic-dimer hydrolase|nr:amidase [Accumulibacter sp.]